MTINSFIKKFLKLTFILCMLVLIIIVSLYSLARLKVIKLPEDIAIQLKLEPPIKEQIGEFIILPHLYKFSESEKNYFLESSIKTIFILEGNSEDNVLIGSKLGSNNISKYRIFYINANSDYKLCNKPSLQTLSKESKADISTFELIEGDCNSNSNTNRISNITKFVCKDIFSNCQKEFEQVIQLEDTYVYFQVSPFTRSDSTFSIITEQNKGSVIITWDSHKLPYNLTQKSYSLEYLDVNKKRISAFGKIESSNQGDSYLPPTNLSNSEIEIKLRIWYSFSGIDFKEPTIYSKTFTYKNYLASSENTNSAPVEMAWVPDWGVAEGISTIQKNPARWNTISPTWYVANQDGTLAVQYSNRTDDLNNLLRANNIKIVPTIMLFDADILKVILHDKTEIHIDEIVNTVVTNGYDGIDLDYESTYSEDQELLTKFVTELAIRLHEKNKSLSFTAVPKIDERKIYSSMPQTHFAQDWVAIGAVVDEFRIMAYDYTAQANLIAGPLSPLPWNESILEYATMSMPANKVVLALPLYSHAWLKTNSTDEVIGINNENTLNSASNNNTSSWQHEDISYIKTHSEYYNESINSWYGEMHAFFKYNGVEREMYYLSPAQINQRMEIAKKYGIKGLCYWRIGGDEL